MAILAKLCAVPAVEPALPCCAAGPGDLHQQEEGGGWLRPRRPRRPRCAGASSSLEHSFRVVVQFQLALWRLHLAEHDRRKRLSWCRCSSCCRHGGSCSLLFSMHRYSHCSLPDGCNCNPTRGRDHALMAKPTYGIALQRRGLAAIPSCLWILYAGSRGEDRPGPGRPQGRNAARAEAPGVSSGCGFMVGIACERR